MNQTKVELITCSDNQFFFVITLDFLFLFSFLPVHLPFQPCVAATRFVYTTAENSAKNKAEDVSGAGEGEYFRHFDTRGRERREGSGRHD